MDDAGLRLFHSLPPLFRAQVNYFITRGNPVLQPAMPSGIKGAAQPHGRISSPVLVPFVDEKVWNKSVTGGSSGVLVTLEPGRR